MATAGRVRRLMIGMSSGLTVALSLLGTGAQDAGAQPIRVENTDQCTSHLGKTSGGGKPAGGNPVGGVVVRDVSPVDTGVEVDQRPAGPDGGAMVPLDE